LEWVLDELNLKNEDDLQLVTKEYVKKIGSAHLAKKGDLLQLLREYFPEHDWNIKQLDKKITQAQTSLLQVVQKLFPGEEIKVNFRHPDLLFSTSQRLMELDIFVPAANLAFEYQVTTFLQR
jgi:hypothetical protein